MTVSELIEKLKEMPQESVVVASRCYEDYSVESVEYVQNKGIVDGNKTYVLIG